MSTKHRPVRGAPQPRLTLEQKAKIVKYAGSIMNSIMYPSHDGLPKLSTHRFIPVQSVEFFNAKYEYMDGSVSTKV